VYRQASSRKAGLNHVAMAQMAHTFHGIKTERDRKALVHDDGRPYNLARLDDMENAIRNAIIKFEQEFMGRGPEEVKAFIIRDLVVVRLKGVLTPAERQLAKTPEGVDMVKRLRQTLIAQGRDKLCEQVGEITGTKILTIFTDINVQIGEKVFVFAMDRELQNEK
jgi:uncharacterized protein YbcI